MATNSGGYSNYDTTSSRTASRRSTGWLPPSSSAWPPSRCSPSCSASGSARSRRRRRPTVVVYLRAATGAAAAAGPQPPAPAAVSVEMAGSVGPLVCTYRRADGWREAACLAELADGEAVRVLPACMHYFHAECVGEWLRAHDTCPLCRTPLDPAAAAAV